MMRIQGEIQGFVSNQAFLPQVRSVGLAQSAVRLTVELVVAVSIPGTGPKLRLR